MKTKKLMLSIIGLSFIALNAISGENELQKGKNGISTAGTQTKESQTNMKPKEALQKLKDGNKRFVENKMLNNNDN